MQRSQNKSKATRKKTERVLLGDVCHAKNDAKTLCFTVISCNILSKIEVLSYFYQFCEIQAYPNLEGIPINQKTKKLKTKTMFDTQCSQHPKTNSDPILSQTLFVFVFFCLLFFCFFGIPSKLG